MAENYTIRRNAERERGMELIREHLTESLSKPSDSDCFDFALKAAARELAGKPKPRSPRKQ
jgi:hypothetical protein